MQGYGVLGSPPRSLARRPSSGSLGSAASGSTDDDLATMERRARRAARKAQREAIALRVSRSVIAPEHWRMFVLRQSLKLWHSQIPRERWALADAETLVRLQARVRGNQQRKRCVDIVG